MRMEINHRGSVLNQDVGRIPTLSIFHFPSNGDGLAGKAEHSPIKLKRQQKILLKRGFKRLGMWDFSRRHTTTQVTVAGRNMSSRHDRAPVGGKGRLLRQGGHAAGPLRRNAGALLRIRGARVGVEEDGDIARE